MGEGYLAFMFAFALIALLIQVVILRRIFKVFKTEAFQRSSLLLLKQIAIKHGVEDDKIEEAMSYFKMLEK